MLFTVGIMIIIRFIALKYKMLNRIQIFQTVYSIIFLKTMTDSMIMIKYQKEFFLSSLSLTILTLLGAFASNKISYLRIIVLVSTVLFSSEEFNKVQLLLCFIMLTVKPDSILIEVLNFTQIFFLNSKCGQQPDDDSKTLLVIQLAKISIAIVQILTTMLWTCFKEKIN